MFQQPLLDLLQAEVVVVEPFAGMFEVEVVLRALAPRKFEHQLQVVHLYRVFRHGGIQPLELVELLVEHFAHLFAPLLRLGLLAHAGDFGFVLVAAQLLLDGAYLLLEVVFFLLLVDILFDLALYLVLQLHELLFAYEYLQQAAGTRQQSRRFEQPLAVGILEVEVGTDEVDDAAFAVDVLDGERCFLRYVGRNADDVQRHVLDGLHERLELHVAGGGRRILERRDRRREVGLRREVFVYLDFFEAVQDDGQVAVGHVERLENAGCRADAVHVVRCGLLDVGLLLKYRTEYSRAGLHVAYQLHGLLPAHRNGGNRAGEQHRAAQREDGQRFGYRIVFRKFVFVFGNYRDDLVVSLLNVGNIRQDIYLYLIAFFAHSLKSPFRFGYKDNESVPLNVICIPKTIISLLTCPAPSERQNRYLCNSHIL